MLRSKRAVEPLIAAVLLIVVTVGIGAVVVGIVRNFVSENKVQIESKSAEMSCSRDVMIEIVKIDGVSQICNGSNYVDIVLENKGVQIDDMQMVIMGESGIYTNASVNSTAFTPGSTREYNGTYPPLVTGAIVQVKFVPKLKKSGAADFNYCSDVAIKYEGLQSC
jgi:FlaG/FlaF family flagellin (archaellin)